MLNKLKKLLLTFIFIFIGVLLLYFVFKNIDFESFLIIIKKANPIYLIIYILISIGLFLLNVLRWKIIVNSQHINVSFSYLLSAYLAGYGISYVTPSAKLGGEPLRTAFLHRKGVKTENALSTVIIDKTLELGGSGLFFLIAGIILLFFYNIPRSLFILIIGLVFLFVLIGIFLVVSVVKEKDILFNIYKLFKLHKLPKLYKITQKIISTEKLVRSFYKRDKKHFLLSLFVMLIAWILMFVEFKMGMLLFGFNPNMLQIFLTFSLVGVAYILPVPFAIGTLEGGQVLLYSILGLNPVLGLGISFLTRIRDSIVAGIGLLISIYYGATHKFSNYTHK